MPAYLSVVVGLALLLVAGDLLVRGAVNTALRLGVPALIVSLTIVAFGTSAPELLISVGAVLDGAPGLALGNVVGSNIANVFLVLGVPALLARLGTEGDTRQSFWLMIAATVLFIVLAFMGPISVPSGIILLAGLAVMLGLQARNALAHRRSAKAQAEAEMELEGADPSLRWWKILLFLALGLVGLPIGANLLITGATEIALAWGLSETVIGLTLVAIGTSLPELATTVMAAIRRQADVALGNVIGSNMFNLLGILGVASLVGPIPVEDAALHFDIWVMLAAALVVAPFALWSWQLGRRAGLALTLAYVAYLTVTIIWGT
ncbi:calcium/sodium antiporter [Mesobaculum littorinae]|uniref:Calcium/sodium antiporter n=1 Tax=Mesobaculum littorinae TaxID=2486419 RepID=A0A438AIB4_9RHOB|nr:calcium/sodium antiporter [Mesobaculum littorinae]RVV98337.1 calcium/sodium antiporter [Mesobaculum littorinae]